MLSLKQTVLLRIDKWGKDTELDLLSAIESKKVKRLGRLKDSLVVDTAEQGDNVSVKIRFFIYGRLLDSHRRNIPIYKLNSLGHQVRRRDRDRKWYNKRVGLRLSELRQQLPTIIKEAIIGP